MVSRHRTGDRSHCAKGGAVDLDVVSVRTAFVLVVTQRDEPIGSVSCHRPHLVADPVLLAQAGTSEVRAAGIAGNVASRNQDLSMSSSGRCSGLT